MDDKAELIKSKIFIRIDDFVQNRMKYLPFNILSEISPEIIFRILAEGVRA
jgi:hypothetical protein